MIKTAQKEHSIHLRVCLWIKKQYYRINYVTSLLRGRWRVAMGVCPMCASATPQVDTCPLCDVFRSLNRWPPSDHVRTRWWYDYRDIVKAQLNVRRAVLASRGGAL